MFTPPTTAARYICLQLYVKTENNLCCPGTYHHHYCSRRPSQSPRQQPSHKRLYFIFTNCHYIYICGETLHFSSLVTRANKWLRENGHVRVKVCESIEVKGRYDGVVDTHKSSYFEGDHIKKKMRNMYIRALRYEKSRDCISNNILPF